MKKQFEFCLTGYGYLNDLDMTEKTAKARIQVMPLAVDSGDAFPDAIFLECDIAPELLAEIRRLDKKCPVTGGVVLRFRVVYTRFGFCHEGRQPYDPSHMLQMHGKLVAIEEWFRDGTRQHKAFSASAAKG